MSCFEKWVSPWNFLRVDVDLEDFVSDTPNTSDDITPDNDVGTYPERIEGPESAALEPEETVALLAKKLLPRFLSSFFFPPSSPTASTSDSGVPLKTQPPKKILSKPALERAQRSREHRRAKRRACLAEAQKEAGTSLKAITLRRAAAAKCVAETTSSLSDYRHSPSGYAGYAEKTGRTPVGKNVSGLVEDGFQYIEWDGRQGIYIVDRYDRVIVCGGSPNDSKWEEVAIDAANAIKGAREKCDFTSKDQDHRRGRFPAMARGVSFGNGLRIPSNIRPQKENRKEAMDSLILDPAIKRIAGFQWCLLDGFSPDLGGYYKETLDVLISKDPRLEKNFANSSFGAITVNFGPRTVSVPHVDHANLATGMCALTALGDFDPDEGGHLVLWDLKVIIRFPPGSSLLFPSALVKHSNIPIRQHEQRYSVTQYSASGLFRWVENGFCSDKDTKRPKGAERQAWEKGIKRLQVRHGLMPEGGASTHHP